MSGQRPSVPLDPAWTVVGPSLAITDSEAIRMAEDIRTHCGSIRRAAAVLGIPGRTLKAWVEHTRGNFSPAARHNVWLVWCLLFDPGRVKTAFDLATWGRFRATAKPVTDVSNLPDPFVRDQCPHCGQARPGSRRAKRQASQEINPDDWSI